MFAPKVTTMERQELYGLVEQLATGFETLQDEYQKLFGRHQALERKLATAREQVRADTPVVMYTRWKRYDEVNISSRSGVACGVDRFLFKLTLTGSLHMHTLYDNYILLKLIHIVTVQ